ncbi:hypothetical protein JCGZ_23414 [Jatropha curcas]|uniref:DCD domain-containing protein n=1 Tax=Jatropha curcas TaxID=180498 RepID=A0A067JI05_JATCU|nr:hypothetical protein JCGZ_23414 [Jatropha curcas]
MQNKESGNPGETPIKPESSKKITPKSLRAKSEVKKKSLKVKKAKDNPRTWGRNRKKKNNNVVQENKEGDRQEHKNDQNPNSEKEGQNKGAHEEHNAKQQETEKSQERVAGSSRSGSNLRSEGKPGSTDKSSRSQKNKGKPDVKEGNRQEHKNDQNPNSREEKLKKKGAHEEHNAKHLETQKSQERIAGSSRNGSNLRSEGKPGNTDKNSRSQRNKEKLDLKEKSQRDERKEKLGGLIFMCSAKTKPDCFRYQVMGVTGSKKDLVLGVKPGLKLFLYDFDLRLMYGIYKASSSGGMRLEPKAFGGSFPVQVRFSIHKDCFPLPESVFKRAIKDNYDEKNKFKIELTVRQVRKLSELFRPAIFQSVQSATVPIHSPAKATMRDREACEGQRDLRRLSDRETFARVSGDGRSYPVVPHERDQGIGRQEVVLRHKEETSRDLYMSEKDYRTYGLQRERRNVTPVRGAPSTLDLYQRDLERDQLLRQPAAIYGDTVPIHKASILADPLYLAQREFQTYNLSGRSELPPAAPSVSAAASGSAITALDLYTRDPYYSYQHGAPASSYVLPPRREEVSSASYYSDSLKETYLTEADPLRRSETDQMDKLHLKYAIDPIPDYRKTYQGAKPEIAPPPVSSRYSFAGPSMSYR